MLGDQIRDARELRGWTQEELATRLKVGKKSINNWESNRTYPKNRIGMIRDVLGIDVNAEPVNGPLAHLSDLTLLSELTRRAIERERSRGTID